MKQAPAIRPPGRRGRGPCRLRGAVLALAFGAAPAFAQLPVGGFLGPWPLDDEVQEQIEQALQNRVEQVTEQNIQENIEETIEETIEQSIDDSVEDTVEESVAETVEESVEDGVTTAVEDSVEEDVAATVEGAVEEDVATAVEEDVEEDVAATVEDSVEEEVAANVEDAVEEEVETGIEGRVEKLVDTRVATVMEDRLETEIDEIVEDLESNLEVDEGRIQKEQWLVMAEPAAFEELDDKGYLFATVTDLPGLGLRLAEVAAPSTFDITEVRRGVLDVVGKDRAEVDLNHIYTASAPLVAESSGVPPRDAMPFPSDLDRLAVRVGMIDSDVDMAHPALARSRIEARSFAPAGARLPAEHGTAIASIIVGSGDDYRGLAPQAHLYAASVFELDAERGEIASTVSLLRALDWLLSAGVDVVNISLAGPPNRLLEAALERAAAADVVIMAAAGNGGPVARPMYPAAYRSVVAVTAVDAGRQVFRLANRGDYLALAAPGVDLRHARPGGGYGASSGTSFAVPFAATAAARLRQLRPAENIVDTLYRSALDLGPPGRDAIYGYGLLTLAAGSS